MNNFPKQIYTFDIDGTVARVPTMPEEDWWKLQQNHDIEKHFYDNLELAHPELPEFLEHLSKSAIIGFVTARSMRDKQITKNWLDKHKLCHDWLIVNMGVDERVKFCRSIGVTKHFDDHPKLEYLPWVERVWYNEWPQIGSRVMSWERHMINYNYQPSSQLRLF